jgi:hypothetical protein
MPALLEALTVQPQELLIEKLSGCFDRDGSIRIAGAAIVTAFAWRNK